MAAKRSKVDGGDAALVALAQATCKRLMRANDASHDYSHAFRVAATARELALTEAATHTTHAAASSDGGGEGEPLYVDALVVELAATLHDVADHKARCWGCSLFRC